MRYQMHQDTSGEWRWRLRATNHEIIATLGEGCRNKSDCRHAIDLVKGSANAQVGEA